MLTWIFEEFSSPEPKCAREDQGCFVWYELKKLGEAQSETSLKRQD